MPGWAVPFDNLTHHPALASFALMLAIAIALAAPTPTVLALGWLSHIVWTEPSATVDATATVPFVHPATAFGTSASREEDADVSTDEDAGLTDVGLRYRSVRERLGALLRSLPLPPDPAGATIWAGPVLACPGWQVRDVLAHLVGNLEDGRAGRISGPPSPEQTAAQVERHRDEDLGDLLATWDLYAAGGAEASLTRSSAWPAFIDALSHEHDLRAALHRPDRDVGTDLAVAARLLAGDGAGWGSNGSGPAFDLALDGAAPLRLLEGVGSPVQLSIDSFTWFRLRMGRRTHEQVLRLAWSADPTPLLDRLFVFGPADSEVEPDL